MTKKKALRLHPGDEVRVRHEGEWCVGVVVTSPTRLGQDTVVVRVRIPAHGEEEFFHNEVK